MNSTKFLDASPIKKVRFRLGASPILSEDVLSKADDVDAFSLDDLTPLCKPYATVWPNGGKQTEAFLHFAVQDSGPGMTAEEQGRIFRKYAQASPKTYREFGGAGLGLCTYCHALEGVMRSRHTDLVVIGISRRLVELHGGAVSLQSQKGVGTGKRTHSCSSDYVLTTLLCSLPHVYSRTAQTTKYTLSVDSVTRPRQPPSTFAQRVQPALSQPSQRSQAEDPGRRGQ